MPRAADSKTMGTHFYHSQFSPTPYESTNVSSSPSNTSSTNQSPSSDTTPKKKHICSTCDRSFTTSGHLARHSRVHTGERNHKCPFPGCETRCSRQDNLQQHFRIHLSPGSRRNSTRSAIARAMNSNAQAGPGYHKRSSDGFSSAALQPPSSAPANLESINRAFPISTPPDSPPPLAHATLPANVPLPTESGSSRSSSSSEVPYSSSSHSQIVTLPNVNGHGTHSYSQYRSGTTTYQEQSQGAGYTYVHTTPITQSSSHSSGNLSGIHGSSFSYPDPHHYDNMNHSPHHTPPPPVSSISSRHSISHISHPQPYVNGHQSSGGPPSPESTASVASHTSQTTSGPATPSYTGYNEDNHYGVVLESSPDLPSVGGGHVNSHGQLVPNGYTSSMIHQNPIPTRFGSPPPVLAPIQGDRAGLRSDQRMSYIQHTPQAISNDYHYHNSHFSVGHGSWKSGLRSKGIDALVQ